MKIKKHILFTLLFILSIVVMYAQYEPEWNNSYGGVNPEWAKAIVETSDHGIILAGYREAENQNKYMWIVKVDKDGNKLWEKTFKEHYISMAESIIETHDENIIIAGNCIKDGDVFSECWIVKLDMFGNKKWERSYGSSGDDGINCIIETKDNGFAAVGFTNRNADDGIDFLALLLDENGDKIWEKTFGGTKEDYAMSIIQTSDNGLAMAGYTRSSGTYKRGSNRSFWVLKTDMDGYEIWDDTFGESWWDVATSITETSDKGLAIVGYTKSEGVVNYDILALKLDKDGKEMWRKTFGDINWDEATSVIETYDKGLLIGGFTRSREANFSNFWIIKLDEEGYELWNNIFERSSVDFTNGVAETFDNGFVVVGSTYEAYSQSSWQAAVLKFVNERRPQITLIRPVENKAVSNTKLYVLQFSAESFKELEEVRILVNDEVQHTITDLQKSKSITHKGITYTVNAKIELQNGTNNVQVECESMHGIDFSDKITIDFVKLPKVRW